MQATVRFTVASNGETVREALDAKGLDVCNLCQDDCVTAYFDACRAGFVMPKAPAGIDVLPLDFDHSSDFRAWHGGRFYSGISSIEVSLSTQDEDDGDSIGFDPRLLGNFFSAIQKAADTAESAGIEAAQAVIDALAEDAHAV